MSRVLRPAACLGLLVTATAIAALLLGRFVVLPMLARADALVDANLAKALAQPVHFRLAEITLAAALVAFVLLPRWSRSKLAGVLAMVLVTGAAVWRAVLLPALYEAWSRVDIVAGRPLDRLRAAERLDGYEEALGLALVMLFAGAAWVALRELSPAPTVGPMTISPLVATSGTINVEDRSSGADPEPSRA
jgi:hypothetical protein